MARAKKGIPEINPGSMADISFLLLSFFLMTSSMDQSAGLQRHLPPMPQESTSKINEGSKVKIRNVFQIKINQWDALFAGGRPMDVSMLRQEVKDFIKNVTDDPDKPEREIQYIKGLGEIPVSKAIISLQNDRGTSYQAYIRVQNEVVAAYNELRDEFARENFNGRTFNQLSEDKKAIVKDYYPQRISEAEPKDVSKKK